MSNLVGAAQFGLGTAEMFILLVSTVLFIWCMWRICLKAGFRGALGLLVLIPGGIFVLLIVLAFVDWPALSRGDLVRQLDSDAPLSGV